MYLVYLPHCLYIKVKKSQKSQIISIILSSSIRFFENIHAIRDKVADLT